MRWDRNYNAPEPAINDPVIIPAYGVTDEERARWNAKQDRLEYDTNPITGSDKMLTSGAVYTALEAYKVQTVQLCQNYFWGQVGGLAQIVDQCESASAQSAGYAADSQSNSYDSEAWAKGTRNGVPVTDIDPAYHNNAKYYAETGNAGIIQDNQTSVSTTWSSSKISTNMQTIDNKATIAGNKADGAVVALTQLSEDIQDELDVKADLENGKVPASQLPSYVDDVTEGYYDEEETHKFYKESTFTTEIPAERDKIYVDLTTLKEYRWTGTVYARLNAGLVLGEIVGTAYEGSKGKTNADNIVAIQAMIPSGASSSDKLVKHSELPVIPTVPTISVVNSGTASATTIAAQYIVIDNTSYPIKGTEYMEQSVTLSTAATTDVVFLNSALTSNRAIDYSCSQWGIFPEDVVLDSVNNTVTVTMPKVDTAVTVTVRIYLR